MPKTKEQLIAELDQARDVMRQLIKDLDTQCEVYPTWTVKELLSHITGWDDGCIASLNAHLTGDVPVTPAARGIDYYNSTTVYERQALPLEHVIREWETTRETLKQMIRSLPESKFYEPFTFIWGEKGTLEDMVNIFTHHEMEHAKEIRGKML